MTLFLLILIVTYFDPNIGFANSLTVLLLAVDFSWLCLRKRIRLSKGFVIMTMLFLAIVVSYILNGGKYEIVMFMAASLGIYVLAFNWFSTEWTTEI